MLNFNCMYVGIITMIVTVEKERKQSREKYEIGISLKPTKNAVMLSYITQFNCANGEASAHFKLGSVCPDIMNIY